MDRKQPIVIGKDKKGELIWGCIPMYQWQKEMMDLAIRAAAAMFPKKYMGDFIAYWHKVKLQQEKDLELDSENASFNSYVPGSMEKKYKNKHNHHSGD